MCHRVVICHKGSLSMFSTLIGVLVSSIILHRFINPLLLLKPCKEWEQKFY